MGDAGEGGAKECIHCDVNGNQSAPSEQAGSLSPRDPGVSGLLMALTFAFAGVGISVGIYGAIEYGAVKGLHYALPLMVGAAGLITCLRYTVFHVSDARRRGVETSSPVFQIELGFLNGAIGIMSLVAFFADWGAGAEVSLALAYAMYLLAAFLVIVIRRVRSGSGWTPGFALHLCFWVVYLGFLFYFGVAVIISVDL